MTQRKKIRVLIADDHNLVRAGIASLLANKDDIEVVGEAANGKEAVDRTKALRPDIVLMDITMPVMDGIKASQQVGKVSPSTRVLVLTQYEQEEYIKRVMNCGVSGYILKSSLVDDLTTAIRTVYGGKRFITPAVSEKLMDAYIRNSSGSRNAKPFIQLTNRETEILQEVAGGLSNLQIATKLCISVRTVEFHRTNIMEKLGVHETASLVKYAIVNKLIDLNI